MPNFAIVFSPTGGTKKVSEIITKEIDANWMTIDLCISESEFVAPSLTSEDVCLIAVPSFAGRVPKTVTDRIRKISGNGAKAILLCVYGNREYDDTLSELQDEAEKAGFLCISAVSAIAEHSIVRKFAKGRPDADDCNKLKEFALKIKEKIENKDFVLYAEIPGKHKEYKEVSKSKLLPKTNDLCVKCGICAKGCPSSAIDVRNLEFTDSEKCIACMKCISICPENARFLDEELLAGLAERLSKVCSIRKNNELFI